MYSFWGMFLGKRCSGFACNGQCLSKELICDGVQHCADGSDEDRYRCHNKTPQGKWTFYSSVLANRKNKKIRNYHIGSASPANSSIGFCLVSFSRFFSSLECLIIIYASFLNFSSRPHKMTRFTTQKQHHVYHPSRTPHSLSTTT